MNMIANVLVAVVAALHVYFLVLEMFLWTRPLGLKTFRNSMEKATESAVLAANQGLYNGFLAAGLIWGWSIPIRASLPDQGILPALRDCGRRLWRGDRQPADSYVQAAPAALALILLWLAYPAFRHYLALPKPFRQTRRQRWRPAIRRMSRTIIGQHGSSDMRNGFFNLTAGTAVAVALWRHPPPRRRNTTPAPPTPRSRSARPCRSRARFRLCQYRQDPGRLYEDDQRAGRHQRPQDQPDPV